MTDAPKPEVGTVIDCTVNQLTKLNSKENACRVQLLGGQWVAVPPADKAGLIVFLRNPLEDMALLKSVTITEVGDRVAFAEPNPSN